RHLSWLASSFRVLALHEIVSRLSDATLPAGACAITFDDGWRDNIEFALPELERPRPPPTGFVGTERVGTQGPCWPDEVCRRLAGLSREEQADLLRRLGVTSRGDPRDALLAHLKKSSEDARAEALDRLRSESQDPAPGARELLDWNE